MTDHDKQRNSEEIEKDINQSRERLDATLHEIEERFSPQQLLNTSYEYLRHGGANEFVSNLGTTIKHNPLPFLVTTAGLGWLMLAQRHPDQAHGQLSQHRYADSGHHAAPGVPLHERHYPDVDDDYGITAEHQSESKGRMSEMTHKVKDSAHHLGEKARQTVHQWGDDMRSTTSHLQHGTHDSLHNLGQRARRSESQASDFIQEHPLVVGALGFALGAALGGIFPATKKEDEYMGEYRDRVLHKAVETGQAQADKAQHAIHEKVEAYKGETAQAQGSNVNASPDASQDSTKNRETGLKDSSTPFAETPGATQPSSEHTPEQNRPERHSPGLAGSSTPSGNTQGSGTNHNT